MQSRQQAARTAQVAPQSNTPQIDESLGPTTAGAGPVAGPGLGSGAGSGVCNPDAPDAEKTAFLAQPTYGPQDLAHAISVGSGVGVGGFEATYIPGTSSLFIRVTGKVRFMDAVQGSHPSYTTQHSNLSNLVTYLNSLPAETAAQVLPFFQWDDTSKEESLELFNQRLSEAESLWQNTGLSFQVNDPQWCDVTAQPVFSLQVGAEGTAAAGEHLQVTVYKEPTSEEQAQMNTILEEASTALPDDTDLGIRANAGSNLGSNAPGYSGSEVDENPLQNEMSLSSSDLLATNDPNERGGSNHLKKTILFGHNEDSLSGDQVTEVQEWIVGFNDGDSEAANNAITLRGFASARGSASYNRDLVDRRIASVRTAIVGAGVSSSRVSTDNRGDAEAESAAVGRDRAAQENERRVEIRIGSGERQNTVAHEFGHVFGLSDEYVEDPGDLGDEAWHNDTAENAGISAGAMREQNDNIISVGNTVRPQHYSTFAWALNQLTAANLGSRVWHVIE